MMSSSSHSCVACPVQRSFCPLVPELRNVFERLKTTTAYRRGDVAFHESDPCHSVFVVCEGGVKLITSSREGRTLLLRIAGPGELLGLAEAVAGGAPYGCSAVAAEPSILGVIPREMFMRFVASYPAASCAIVVALSEQYKIAQRETRFLAFGETSAARLARLLLDWSTAAGAARADGLHIPRYITHTDLAQAIGSTRETVTRILGDFNHRGAVARAADGLVIRNPEELARLAVA